MMTRDVVLGAIVEVCGTNFAQLVDDSSLSDLGIDSLDIVEIVMIVEAEFYVQIEPKAFEQTRTLGDAIALFENLTDARS